MSQIEVDKIIPQSGTSTQLGESGDTITIPAGATITNNGTANGFGSADTEKVKVSANDTTAGFLNGKLVAGTNISLTEGTDGGNETLTAALSGTIATSQIANDAITLDKMAPGTDGNIISYDASGNPVAVATGSAGQVLTSAGAGAPPTFAAGGTNTPNFFAYVSGNFNVNSTTETIVTLNAELYDTASAFNTSNYTFTVPSGQAGKYYLFAQARKDNFSGTRTFFEILRTPSGGSLGGLFIAENSGGSDGYITISGSTVISLSVGDALQMRIYHNDSGSRGFFGGFQNSFFGGYKIIE